MQLQRPCRKHLQLVGRLRACVIAGAALTAHLHHCTSRSSSSRSIYVANSTLRTQEVVKANRTTYWFLLGSFALLMTCWKASRVLFKFTFASSIADCNTCSLGQICTAGDPKRAQLGTPNMLSWEPPNMHTWGHQTCQFSMLTLGLKITTVLWDLLENDIIPGKDKQPPC